MTNHNLVVISDLGGVECWCLRGVAESNSPLPIFSWLLTVTSLSPPHHASHPSLRSLLSADTWASVQGPGHGRVLVKRGNCDQSRSEEWRTAWSRFLMTLLKVKFTESGLLDTAKWSAIRIISIQTTTLPSLPPLLAGPGNFDITLANCSPDYDTW